MNEQELAKKITRHLDDGLDTLSQSTLNKLQLARKHALAHHHAPRTVFGLAWAGHGTSGHGWHGYRFWIPAAALLLVLSGAMYWQNVEQSGDADEIDAALLAGELPVHAYLDEDFNAWLESSSQ